MSTQSEPSRPRPDTPVYPAFAYNPNTVDFDIWRGMGTREAIAKRGVGDVQWCPHEWLVDGWRDTGPP
jgi:hypothetical protein